MIDGSGDDIVNVVIMDTGTEFDFGFYNGGFQQILDSTMMMTTSFFAGGDVVDFAIRSEVDSTVYKLSDGTAMLAFTGQISAGNSVNPTVTTDYWQSVTITWTVDNNDFVIGMSGNDGFAPSSSPVPEPFAALVFTAGLMVVGSRVQRQSRA